MEYDMCLAVPVRVEGLLEAGMLRCRVGEGETFVTVSDALLESPPLVGDYLIVHAGFALRVIETREAEETLNLLRSMVALADEEYRELCGGA
jgi:hydrogenase expression/formation protein HypC